MTAFFHEIGSDLYKFFTSLPLALVLISLIALFSLVGTLVPQETFTREVDYIARYGVAGYQWLKRLQLTNIFGSQYFLFIMALFTLSLSACTYKRLIASWRYWRLPMNFIPPQGLGKFEHARVLAGQVAPDTGTQIRGLLRRRGYRVREQNQQLLAEKWRWERFGIDVFHVSLLIVIFGGLMTMVFGFRTFEIAHQNSIIKLPGADFSVRVNRFWSENYKNSERVMDWRSELTVIEDNKEIVTKTIEVNAPLRYKGYDFYQSAFGTDWQGAAQVTLKISRPDGSELGEFIGKVNEGFEIPNEQLFVKVCAFLPNFALTENLIAFSRTQRLENPAACVEIRDAHGMLVMRTWAFSRSAMQTLWENTMGRVSGETPYRVNLVGMTAPEFTGLQITKDPGRPVIYFGFLFLIVGLLTHMFFKHKQLWVHVTENEIIVAGMVRNNLQAFALEFARFVEELERLGVIVPTTPALVRTSY